MNAKEARQKATMAVWSDRIVEIDYQIAKAAEVGKFCVVVDIGGQNRVVANYYMDLGYIVLITDDKTIRIAW